jgi:hypothetical protein
LGYSGCSLSLDILGGDDHPRTTCSEEAADYISIFYAENRLLNNYVSKVVVLQTATD